VQGKRLTGRLLGAIALGSVFPPLALLPLFDPGEGEQADPCLRGDAAPPASRAASNAR